MKRHLFMMLAMVVAGSVTFAQVSITALSTPVTINFDGFAGAGVAPTPAAGQLDSDDWAFSGFSSGNLAFGGIDTTSGSDYTKGTTTGDIFSGGLYAFDNGANQAMYIQPTGSDWTPGDATLRLQNNTGGNVEELEVDYWILVKNNEGRANSFNFSYSTDNVTYTAVTGADYTSVEAADSASIVAVVTRSVTISGISVADGGFVYLRWDGADGTGSGSRDEFGLDNITVEAVPSGGTVFFNLSASTASGAEGGGAISTDVIISAASDCDVDVNITGGTADGSDYSGGSTTLNFTSGGGTSQTFSITPTDDALFELPETVTIELANATGGCMLGVTAAATFTINDNEVAATGDCSNLYISEYLEGSSNNKAFEIYNPTSSAIDASSYSLQAFNNGSTSPTNQFFFTGVTIAAGDVYVIANPSADSLIMLVADTTSTVTFINGDDAVILLQGSDSIDAIGIVGVDPGSNWEVTDGIDTCATNEFTLVRNPSVKEGSQDWGVGSGQWLCNPQDDFSFLGSHTQDACAVVCSSATAPQNPVSTVGATKTVLTWDPVAGSVACRVQGTRISPPGPSPKVNIFGSEPTTTMVPHTKSGPGTTWEWTVQCACSISPLDITPASVTSTFTVPILRMESAVRTSVFPNPASDRVTITWNEQTEMTSVEIIDLLGSVLVSEQASGTQANIDVSNLESGVYLVRVNGMVANQLTIVK